MPTIPTRSLLLVLLLWPLAAQAQALRPKPLPSDFSVQGLFKVDPDYPFFEHAAQVPFRPEALGHDPVNAWWLSEMTMLAYGGLKPGGLVEQALTTVDLAFQPVGSDAAGGTQGFLAWNERFVIVSLRGTTVDDRQDLLANMRFSLTRGEEGGVHRGFLGALEKAWPTLRAGLRALPGRRVFLTGHSLGGAVASLAAERWIAGGGEVQGVYTFGCPRIGDARLRRRYPVADHYRYEHNNDLVTMVPFDGSLVMGGRLGLDRLGPLSYRHLGELRLITHEGRVVADVERAARVRDRWRGLRAAVGAALGEGKLDLRGLDFVRDHSPRYYAIATWNALADHGPAPTPPRATFKERLKRTFAGWRVRWAQRPGLAGALMRAQR